METEEKTAGKQRASMWWHTIQQEKGGTVKLSKDQIYNAQNRPLLTGDFALNSIKHLVLIGTVSLMF